MDSGNCSMEVEHVKCPTYVWRLAIDIAIIAQVRFWYSNTAASRSPEDPPQIEFFFFFRVSYLDPPQFLFIMHPLPVL